MRIISGSLKGRTINNYNIIGTRPTMDRVKESVFATIYSKIEDSVVLDLSCGSGSLGIEAISNGSKYCYFNDSNKIVINKLKVILKEFKIEDKCYSTILDYNLALKYYKDNNIKFDIVFLDPPYKDLIIEDILNTLDNYKLLNKDSLVICEYSSSINNENNNYELIKNKSYGDKYINIYKYK